jgi:uncharacterized protein (TIGR02594 family)
MNKLLPADWAWLMTARKGAMLHYAVNLYGTEEVPGVGNNPVIVSWAVEVAGKPGVGAWLAEFYKADETPWCGLFVAVCAARAGLPVFNKCLAAREWATWGDASSRPGLGDVLVFTRGNPAGTAGHVGFYVGETRDGKYFHVLGGNQRDQVCIMKLDAGRLIGARREPGAPAGRKVVIEAAVRVSENEA